MEAIATLSLVCNVMQVLSFTGEVFRLCRNISKDGKWFCRVLLIIPCTNGRNTGSPDPTLMSYSERFNLHLTSLSARIDELDAVQPPRSVNQQQGQDDKERLQNLASDLLRDTATLQQTIKKLSKATSKWKAFLMVIKYKVHDRSTIDALEKKIEKAHGILNTEFLGRLWYILRLSQSRHHHDAYV